MIKLFVSDMDATLLDNQSQLPENMEEILDLIEAHGSYFVAASGRSLINLKAKFGDLSDRISYISDNGATLTHQGEIIYINEIDVEVVKDTILKLREAEESTTVLITPDNSYYEHHNENHKDKLKEYYDGIILVDDLIDYADKNVIKITTLSLNYNFENFENHINNKLGDSIYGVPSADIWTDITNKGVNKAKALEHLLDVMDIHKDKVITFGDYYNDLELIKYVKYGHAVENAPEDIKEHAYRVIGSNESGAVVKTIVDYIEKGIED